MGNGARFPEKCIFCQILLLLSYQSTADRDGLTTWTTQKTEESGLRNKTNLSLDLWPKMVKNGQK